MINKEFNAQLVLDTLWETFLGELTEEERSEDEERLADWFFGEVMHPEAQVVFRYVGEDWLVPVEHHETGTTLCDFNTPREANRDRVYCTLVRKEMVERWVPVTKSKEAG